MNKTQLIIAIGLALQTSAGFGYTFAAGTGQLSYTFFNLNKNNVTLYPYAAGTNSNGQTGSTSVSTGWDNTAGNYGGSTLLSMFNSGLTSQTASQYCNKSEYHINSPIFFASNADPVTTPPSTASYLLQQGNTQNVVEASGQSYELLNPPAMADSLMLKLDTSGDYIVIANMASTSNMLISGNDYYTSNWPFCYSYNGEYYNADINPSDPNNSTANSYTPPGATSAISQWTNPLGAGFVPAGQTMNLNVSPTDPSYSPTGGLWSGINVNNSSNVALNSVNYSMYPINLSSYVLPNNAGRTVPGSGSINGSTSYNYNNQYYTSIYGGHFTLSIGDPYMVSSFAAKMLWTLVTSPNYDLNPNSLSTSDISVGSTSISAIASGAFYPNTTPAAYATWLIGSPQLAQQAFTNAVTANSPPITSTHEKLWGKLVNGILRVGVDAAMAFTAIETGGSSLAVQMSVAGASDATGAFGSDVTDAITNAATTTTTLSPPPPQSTTALPVVNNTYASSNLLGLWMANSFVQAEINAANGNTGDSSFVLWSSASINVDQLCETDLATSSSASTVSVSNNLLSGSCYTTTNGTLNNGDNGTTAIFVTNGPGATAQTYTNPLSLFSESQSTSQINLWGPIMTGSDITTGSSGTANGYMLLGNPTLPAFSPPTQMVTAGGIASPITNVNTTFNQNSGMMSVASYTTNGTSTTPTPASPAAPMLVGSMASYTLPVPPFFLVDLYYPTHQLTVCQSTGLPGWCYDNNSAIFYTFGYTAYVNGTWYNWYPLASLDMTTCALGSNVNMTIGQPSDYGNGSGASTSLGCVLTTPAVATGSNPVPSSWPTLTLAVGTTNGDAMYWTPTAQTTFPPATGSYYYDTNTGTLVVNGYFGASSQSGGGYSFANDVQSISLTTCAMNMVTLTITPSTTSGDASGAIGALSCGTPPSTIPNLTTVLGSLPSGVSPVPTYSNPAYVTTAPPAAGAYNYNSSTGILTVNGYTGSISSTSTTTFGLANGAQSINVTTCPSNSVTLTLTPGANTTSSDASGASGTLSCGTPLAITVVNATTAAANNTIQPANVTYSGTTIKVGGFTVGTGTPPLPVTPFTSIDQSGSTGSLSLDTSTCNQSIIRSTLAYNSSTSSYTTQYTTTPLNVTLTVYPIGNNNTSVMGVLSCQSPPTLSYNACTSDPMASGALITALTGPGLPNPQGATFELACTCIPSYMSGPDPTKNASASFTSSNFIATGGTDSSGNPNGVVVGATSTYPAQQCPQNW